MVTFRHGYDYLWDRPPPYEEIAFTAANGACGHPERWHADDDESAEHEVTDLVAAFVTALQPDLVLEAGTAFGQTAEKIGQRLAANGHGHCVSLDIEEDRLVAARERCAGLPVTFECADALGYVPPGMIDFAWIDSGRNRAAEIIHLSTWIRSGAIVGVHDTGPQHAIRGELEEVEGYRRIFLPTPRGVGFLEKI